MTRTGDSPCAASEVLVVVDAQSLGAEPAAACAEAGGTGVELLRTAGFQTTGTTRFGSALVCRIDDVPAARQRLELPGGRSHRERCTDTPPATAYWSYWHAAPGDCTWTYSQQGVVTRRPEAGGADGWSFALGAAPGDVPPPRIDPCDQSITLRTAGRDAAPASTGADDAGRVDPILGIALLALLLLVVVLVRRRRRGDA